MNNAYFEIIAILILIAANGFFSLSEFSIIASRKSKLKQMAEEGNHAASRAAKIQAQPESFLATVQVGITFVGVLAGVFSGMTIVGLLKPYIVDIPIPIISNSAQTLSFIIVVITIASLTIVLGELVPKYLALSGPEKIASAVSAPMIVFSKAGFFFVKFLNGIARLLLRLFGLKKIPERSSITEDEINYIIADGKEKGIFDATEQELIHSVFDFADTTVRQSMTPRIEIIGIDANEKADKILEEIAQNDFSRYPVYSEDLDKIEGIIYTKDIIRVLQGSRSLIMNDIVRKAHFVPDSMKLSKLLTIFQQKKIQMVLVLDEFGGTAGLITLEDVLEEIVGEIQDEFDTDQREFVKENDSVAFASASFRVDELNDDFDTELPEDGPDTLGGLVFEHLQHPAVQGETMVIEGLKFEILEVDGNRIKRLRIEKELSDNQPADQD
ncbi:MAG: HlyC/CorC family transporter [candidate division Zixibacteria bacterium]|nr:HlyC/CorC family transporter [candidate division Zixibacteria bacterium]